eukprot:CAMPEP_0183447568 /NCGR_PEP_ID=MMETSP0370-20130417/103020_1 /TAXON_ID=268820 /ORGANISM="Peridinium aciculiferum, Strain PAER-2" /LENGTH=31 /DNA_ID= /DNA_START= /DNA_END= /DNA_ORIENTATION=
MTATLNPTTTSPWQGQVQEKLDYVDVDVGVL